MQIGIDRLKLIFNDYWMDMSLPSVKGFAGRKAFAEASYRKWAAKELYYYIQKGMYPLSSASVDEIIFLIKRFIKTNKQCKAYSRKEEDRVLKALIYIGEDVLDLFLSMKR